MARILGLSEGLYALSISCANLKFLSLSWIFVVSLVPWAIIINSLLYWTKRTNGYLDSFGFVKSQVALSEISDCQQTEPEGL